MSDSDKMTRVRWEIDVPGDTPEAVAFEALKILSDPSSRALVFSVRVRNGAAYQDVDLEQFAVCDNCGEIIFVNENNCLTEIEDLYSRITPGGMVPSCVCPKCGSLAYPAREMARKG